MIQNITLEMIAATVVFIGSLYAGVKYLKKELKDGIAEMMKDEFKGEFNDVNKKLDNDNKRIKALEDQSAFILSAISLLLQDDLAILEHLRTDNNTGKMVEQEKKVQDFLISRQ